MTDAGFIAKLGGMGEVPPAERTENVRHMLDNYRPYDFDTWDEVRDNNVWDHPKMRAFVDDIRRRGVLRPIPVDYEQDPPQVRNGHTRLLAAELAGVETVPTRQHHGWLDPDDDLEDEGTGRLQIPPEDHTAARTGDDLLGHFEAGATPMIDLYHHTTPENAASITSQRRFTRGEPSGRGPLAFFTTDPDPETSEGAGRGGAVVHIRVPGHLPVLDDEFPGGERHYSIPLPAIRPEHFQVTAAAEDYGLSHRPDETGPPLHDMLEGGMMPGDFYERMHEYNPYQGSGDIWGDAAYAAMSKIRRFQGKPEKNVTIWRAAPALNPESRNAKRGEINHGDWVGISREKALAESYEANDPSRGSLSHDHPRRYHIWQARVPASQVRNAGGDITEWGYFGPDVKGIPHVGEWCSHKPRVLPVQRPYQGDEEEDAAATQGQKEAAVQHYGISGETAPEGHEVWAEPQPGRSPAGPETYQNMTSREPGEWYHGIGYHGPYHIIRHPQTRETWVVDRHGRDASPHGRSYGNRERDGSWGEHSAEEHWRGLESAGPDAHRTGTDDDPRFSELMSERVPEFPHTRVDPEDLERLKRPDARAQAPEGHSPSDEYHGSYEVVRHPGTNRFHVIDNAGRAAGNGWNGAETQLQAERSRDYIERRQRSKEIGRGIADSLWNSSHEILDPGGTSESRESERNLATGQELMTRYEGAPGQVKFDPDDEGGQPYYEREHHLPGGAASGWYAKHYGGTHAEVYHRATGDDAHDMLRFPEHPEDEGSMTPRLHPGFRDQDLAARLREWHDDEEGGARQYLEESDPRIKRWRRRRTGAAQVTPPAGEDPLQPGAREAAVDPRGSNEACPDCGSRRFLWIGGSSKKCSCGMVYGPDLNRNPPASFHEPEAGPAHEAAALVAHFEEAPPPPAGWSYDHGIHGIVQARGPQGEEERYYTDGSGLEDHRHPSDPPGPLYHGTRREFRAGEHIEAGHPGNFTDEPLGHVYLTEYPEDQQDPWVKGARGYGRRVYEVRPTGWIGHRSDAQGHNWATQDPVEVLREVPDPRDRTAALEVTAVEEGPYQPEPEDHELRAHMEEFHSYPKYLSPQPAAEDRKEHGWRHDPGVGPAPFGPWKHHHVPPARPLRASDKWKEYHPETWADTDRSGGSYRDPVRAIEQVAQEDPEAEDESYDGPPEDPGMRHLNSRDATAMDDDGDYDDEEDEDDDHERDDDEDEASGQAEDEGDEYYDRHVAEQAARRAALPYVPPPPEGELIDHVHHMHGLDARVTDLHHSPQGRQRWHNSEHAGRQWQTVLRQGEVPHQHEEPRGIPGERQWPDAFSLSEHTDFAGGTPGVPGKFDRVLSDPAASRPFQPLMPSESSLSRPVAAGVPDPRHPHRDPSALTAADRERLSHMGDDEANALDPMSDEHEHVWGFRNDRPHESHRADIASATENRDDWHPRLAQAGHAMEWLPEHHGEIGYAPTWLGTCAHCGATISVGASATTAGDIGRCARDEPCTGPGTAWQNDLIKERRLSGLSGAVSDFGQAVKDNLDRQWLRDQGLGGEAALAVTAGDDDEDDDPGDEADEEDRQSYRRMPPEQDEDGFIWSMRRGEDDGITDRDPDEVPACTHCGTSVNPVRHWPEDGHDPEVQARMDRREQHERDLDEGRYDQGRFCNENCQRGYEEDVRHGISTHHTFAVGEPEWADDPHPLDRQLWQRDQQGSPHAEPADRRPSGYEARDPRRDLRCHYCRARLVPGLGGHQAALAGGTHEHPEGGPADLAAMHEHLRREHGWDEPRIDARDLPAASGPGRRMYHLNAAHAAEHEATARAGDPHGHFGFYRGLDRDDVAPRTHDLAEHLRSDHEHWRMHDNVDRAYSDAYSHERDEPNAARWRRYHVSLEGLHRQAHDREMSEAEAAASHGSQTPAGEELRRQLETAHHPQQQAENDEDQAQREAIAEHRENGSVQMHGSRVGFGEMEAHLREGHGFEEMPEYHLPTYTHGPDRYAGALEEAHELAHGEMGSYRHDDDNHYAEMHGQLHAPWEAEQHLVHQHGFDLGDLRRDEPSMEDLEHQHNENHERDRRFLSHQLGDRMNEEGRIEHPREWTDEDEERYQGEGTLRNYVPHRAEDLEDTTIAPVEHYIQDQSGYGGEHEEPHAEVEEDPVFGRRYKASRDLVGHFEGEAAVDPRRRQVADAAASMLAYDRDLPPGDRSFLEAAIDHVRRGAPASEPINAGDAEHMARSMRANDRLRDAGWGVHDVARYPRGVVMSVGDHHRATISPNTPSGWHVRTHPADYGSAAAHLHHDLDVPDEDLPGALRAYYASPQVREALAGQRAEVIAETAAQGREASLSAVAATGGERPAWLDEAMRRVDAAASARGHQMLWRKRGGYSQSTRLTLPHGWQGECSLCEPPPSVTLYGAPVTIREDEPWDDSQVPAYLRRRCRGAPSREASAQDAVPSFTWRGQVQGPAGYEDAERTVTGPFYHGSRSRRLQPGSQVKPGMPTNPWGDEGPRSQRVHFTTSLGGAADYARRAGGHVYEVEPTGEVRQGYDGSEWKSDHPLRVIRRVPEDEVRAGTMVIAQHVQDAVPGILPAMLPVPFTAGDAVEALGAMSRLLGVVGNGMILVAGRMDEVVCLAVSDALRDLGTACLLAAQDAESSEGTWGTPKS